MPHELWDAAEARQDEFTVLYENQTDGSRAAVRHRMANDGMVGWEGLGALPPHRRLPIASDDEFAASPPQGAPKLPPAAVSGGVIDAGAAGPPSRVECPRSR